MILAVSFIAISVGSAVYMSTVTLNYLNYYPALGQLNAQILSISVVQGSNWSKIDSRIEISNPFAYSGFKPAEADISIFFQVNATTTLFEGNSLNDIQTLNGQLGPHSSTESNIMTQLNPLNATSLGDFVGKYDGAVMANVTLTVYLITFLDPTVGRTPVTTSNYLPLSTV